MTVLLCTSISCFLLFFEKTGKDVELYLDKLIDKNEAKTYVRENMVYTGNNKESTVEVIMLFVIIRHDSHHNVCLCLYTAKCFKY